MNYEKDFEQFYTDTSLGRIHSMVHRGDGRPVVFLHGLGASVRAWKKLVEFLPSDFYACLVDLVGHGLSDAPDIKYTIDMQARMLAELFSGLGIGSPYLFGNSYGGWIAAYYASSNFGYRGLILEDSAGVFPDDATGKNRSEAAAESMRRYIAESANIDVVEQILKNSVEEKGAWLTSERLSKISKRTMILWGGEDEILDKKFAYVLKEGIPGSIVHIVEGAGHVPHYTNPGLVAELLLDFISYK